jgi:hypothetical protein
MIVFALFFMYLKKYLLFGMRCDKVHNGKKVNKNVFLCMNCRENLYLNKYNFEYKKYKKTLAL